MTLAGIHLPDGPHDYVDVIVDQLLLAQYAQHDVADVVGRAFLGVVSVSTQEAR